MFSDPRRRRVSRVVPLTVLVLCLYLEFGWASHFGSDPIRETQSNVVPVTEENIKDEGKPGAPAPTFRILEDSSKFLVKDPIEEIAESAEIALQRLK